MVTLEGPVEEPLALEDVDDLTELAFLGAGGWVAGASLRLRSSTMVSPVSVKPRRRGWRGIGVAVGGRRYFTYFRFHSDAGASAEGKLRRSQLL